MIVAQQEANRCSVIRRIQTVMGHTLFSSAAMSSSAFCTLSLYSLICRDDSRCSSTTIGLLDKSRPLMCESDGLFWGLLEANSLSLSKSSFTLFSYDNKNVAI